MLTTEESLDRPCGTTTSSSSSFATALASAKETQLTFLQCSKCCASLADASALCFFEQACSQHLIIRHELQGSYAKGSDIPITFKPQNDTKKLKISSHEAFCRYCEGGVGSLNAIGPAREYVLCFRAKTTCLVRDSSEMRGDWPTVSKFVPEIEQRNIVSFYGGVSDAGCADIVHVPVRLPTFQDVLRGSLRELSIDKPRPYQIESFVCCAERNTILYLPTGAGKTLVSVMIISLLHKLNPTKTIFFVVERVPLVFQQAQYIIEQTNLNILVACGIRCSAHPGANYCWGVGETAEEIPVRRLREYPVIATTAQVLINFINRGWVRMEDASLIVFDEIHHAVKAHPYVSLIERHYQPCAKEYRPLLLGLTASPVAGSIVDMSIGLAELCERTDASVFMPCLYWEDLLSSVNRPQISFVVVEATEEGSRMAAAIAAYCAALMRNVRERLGIKAAMELPGIFDTERTRGMLRNLSERAHAEKNEEAVNLLLHIQQIVSAQELNSILGPRYARTYIEDLFSHLRRDKSGYRDAESVSRILAEIAALDTLSAKLTQLLRLLRESECAASTRAIVFVQTKKTARHLCRVIESDEALDERWKPASFVGQSAGQLDGMSWADQQSPVLQKFRTGEHRLLISTSVLQEGIDVPICDRIILFDQSWTLTSFIQARGRARAKDSQYILICNQEQRLAYETLMRSEAMMHLVILRHMHNHQSLNPRLTLASIHLTRHASQAVNWSNQMDVSRIGDSSITTKDIKKAFKAIHLAFHNLGLEGGDLSLDTFEFLRELGLKNMSGRVESDKVFPERRAFVIKAEPSLGNSMRMVDVARLIHRISQHLSPLDSLASFRVGALTLNRSTEQFMFTGENLDLGTLVNPRTFNILSSLKMPLRIGLNMALGILQVFFVTVDQRVFRIDLDFTNIERLILIDLEREDQATSIYVPLRGAAAYFYAHTDSTVEIKLTTVDLFAWERASGREIEEFMDIGDISVFKLDVFLSKTMRDYLFSILRRVEAYGLTVLFGTVNCHRSMSHMLSRDSLSQVTLASQEFKSVYDVLVLSSSCYPALMHRTSASAFLGTLASVPEGCRHRVLMDLCLELTSRPFVDVMETFDRIAAAAHPRSSRTPAIVSLPYDSSEPTYDDSSNTTLVRYVALTPTRVIFQAPKKMKRNRILRAFDPEYFLRVLFRDEDLQRLSSAKSGASMKCVYNRIADFLVSGIIIGDRKYEFLAMSSSQLRDHGCWFVCPHYMEIPGGERGEGEEGSAPRRVLVDADYIRSWCGDFGSIKNVAKYVARLGQSLSASLDVSQVPEQEYQMIPDHVVVAEVNGKRKTYTYSDGIGVIPHSVAKTIATRMGLERVPTAYQIRFAGFKGVLATDPYSPEQEEDEQEGGGNALRKIQFRPSMKKFTSMHQTLEVLNWSEYVPCYLNRQVLMIASSLGVPDESFIRLQDQMLKKMPDMLLDRREASCALSQSFKILPRLPFTDIASWSFDNEPFFRSLLLAMYRRQLVELLTRSRVFIPMGRILMGTIDETGLLGEDEVFVQVSRQLPDDEAIERGLLHPAREDRYVVVAEVAIAKNPCMHPGDMRKLRAVRNAHLERYHYDCVVFPRTGPRPITDMCSGSDLDGDLYFVTWDPSLLPPHIHEPMDYSAPAAKEVEQVTLNDIRQFLVNFIANDQLGTIANSHVAHADLLVEGVRAPLCMQLAYIFSLAVDFPKTGIIPAFPKEGRVTSWPDFMQKHGQTTHISQKVMGKMFRKARTVFYSGVSYAVDESRLNESLLVEGHEEYLSIAASRYREYCDILTTTLRLYGLSSEAPIFSGSLIELSAGAGAGASREDTKDMVEIVGRKVGEIVHCYRRLFMEDVAQRTEEVRKLASAWYRVAYSSPIKPRGFSAAILSFPWIVGDYLMSAVQDLSATVIDDTSLQLGLQIVAAAREIIGEEINASSIERLNFFVLLRNLLRAAVGPEVRIELSGTTLGHLHAKTSDINIYVEAAEETMRGAVVDVLASSFVVSYRHGNVEHRGLPFGFTLFRNPDWHRAALVLRQVILPSAENVALSLVLLKWARAQNLVRSSARHSGRISATALLLLCSQLWAGRGQVGPQMEEGDGGGSQESESESGLSALDVEMQHLINVQKALASLDSARTREMGLRLLEILRFLAFEEESTIKTTISSNPLLTAQMQGHHDCSAYLREFAFQAYHLLAQTLQVKNLWEMSHTPEVEREVAISRKRPRLARKYGVSNSIFMEGASVLLFEGSSSAKDSVHFDLYQMRRRPQHVAVHCYLPALMDPSSYDPLDTSQYLYQQYFAHAFRQFDLARRTGSAEYGAIRAVAKFGCLYVTNLPRLFEEEGLSASVGRVQEALFLGYRAVGDVGSDNYLRGKNSGFALDFAREEAPLSTSPLVTPSTEMEKKLPKEPAHSMLERGKEEDEVKFARPLTSKKKKTNLSAMNSSFEPVVLSEERMRTFLAENGFVCAEGVAGYAVSLTLFNSSTNGNCDFQVVYNSKMEFRKMRYRPLRWMLADVRGIEADGRDYRFLLSSSKSVELEECQMTNMDKGTSMDGLRSDGDDLRSLIKRGIVSIESNADGPMSTLRVAPEFRRAENLLVRSSYAEKFRLATSSLARDFLARHQPALQTVTVGMLERMRVVLVQVTEYSGHDEGSGLFREISDKSEVELSFAFDWAELCGDISFNLDFVINQRLSCSKGASEGGGRLVAARGVASTCCWRCQAFGVGSAWDMSAERQPTAFSSTGSGVYSALDSGRRKGNLVELEKRVQLREETLGQLLDRVAEQLSRLQREEVLLEEKIRALEAGETAEAMEMELEDYQYLDLGESV